MYSVLISRSLNDGLDRRRLWEMLTDLVEATFWREDGDVAIVTSSSSTTHYQFFDFKPRVLGFESEEKS